MDESHALSAAEALARLADEHDRALDAARREAERHAAERAYLAQLAQDLGAEDDPHEMFRRVVERLLPVVEGVDAILCTVGSAEEGLVPLARAGTLPPPLRAMFERPVRPDQGGVAWSVLAAGHPVWLDDYAATPDASPPLVACGVRGLAHLPIGRLDGRHGLLTAFRFGEATPWSADARALLEATAAALRVHLERAARMEDLRASAAFAEALVRVAALAEAESDPADMTRRAVAEIAHTADLDVAGLATLDDDGLQVRVLYPRDAPPDFDQRLLRGDGVLWRALDAGQPVFLDDYVHAPGAHEPFVELGLRSVAFVPFGPDVVMAAARLGRARPWSTRDRDLLTAAARAVRAAVARRRTLTRLEEESLRDGLTGAYNRRALDADLAAAIAEADPRAGQVSLLILDVDRLKQVNDAEGHARGDALLRDAVRALQGAFRHGDRVYRLGGDEFAVLLRGTGPSGRAAICVRVRAAVAQLRRSFPDADLSAGLAAYPEEASDGHALFTLADARMYDSKAAGRSAVDPG